MNHIDFRVDGKVVDIGAVWVHMKDPAASFASHYSLAVPMPHVSGVFDPTGRRPTAQSWSDFILSDVNELGTFILESHFDAAADAATAKKQPYKWVVATLDTMDQTMEHLTLKGRISRFDPQKI